MTTRLAIRREAWHGRLGAITARAFTVTALLLALVAGIGTGPALAVSGPSVSAGARHAPNSTVQGPGQPQPCPHGPVPGGIPDSKPWKVDHPSC